MQASEGTETPLVAAIAGLDVSAGPAGRVPLHMALLEARLLVVGLPMSGRVGSAPRLAAASALRADGRPALLAFTEPEAMHRWVPKAPWAAVSTQTVCGLALVHGVQAVVLDAAGPVSLSLEEWELRALAEGRTPNLEDAPSLEASTAQPLLVAPRADVAPPLWRALVDAVRVSRGVCAAYLLEGPPVVGRRHLVVGLELDETEEAEEALEQVANLLRSVALGSAPAHPVVSFAVLPQEPGPRAAWVLRRRKETAV